MQQMNNPMVDQADIIVQRDGKDIAVVRAQDILVEHQYGRVCIESSDVECRLVLEPVTIKNVNSLNNTVDIAYEVLGSEDKDISREEIVVLYDSKQHIFDASAIKNETLTIDQAFNYQHRVKFTQAVHFDTSHIFTYQSNGPINVCMSLVFIVI